MLKKYEKRKILGAPEQVMAVIAIEEETDDQEIPHVSLH